MEDGGLRLEAGPSADGGLRPEVGGKGAESSKFIEDWKMRSLEAGQVGRGG